MRKAINLSLDLGDRIESNGEFFVFNVLTLHMDYSNIVYHKIADMCKVAKCGPKAFKNHLFALIEQGFVLPVGNGYMVNPDYASKVVHEEDFRALSKLYKSNLQGEL